MEQAMMYQCRNYKTVLFNKDTTARNCRGRKNQFVTANVKEEPAAKSIPLFVCQVIAHPLKVLKMPGSFWG